MTTTVNLYRLFCFTENTLVTVWNETTPTACPNNNTHTIDTNSITIIDSVSEDQVLIDNGIPGRFQMCTMVFNVPAGNTGDVYTEDVSFPFDMDLLMATFYLGPEMVGDTFSVIVAPNTTISVLAAAGTAGDTTLILDPSVFSAGLIIKGIYISISDGTTTQGLGRVIAYDSTNYTITVENALNQNYALGSQIMMSIHLVDNFRVTESGYRVKIGNKGFNSSRIPANTIIRFAYMNSGTSAKTLNFILEYNYS